MKRKSKKNQKPRPEFSWVFANITHMADKMGYENSTGLGWHLKYAGLRNEDGSPSNFAIDAGFGIFKTVEKEKGEIITFFTWHCERVLDWLIYKGYVDFSTYTRYLHKPINHHPDLMMPAWDTFGRRINRSQPKVRERFTQLELFNTREYKVKKVLK